MKQFFKTFAARHNVQTMFVNGFCIMSGNDGTDSLDRFSDILKSMGIRADEEVDINGNDVLVAKL